MPIRWHRFQSGLLVVAVFGLVACRPQAAPTPPSPPTPDERARQLRTFEALLGAVRADFVYGDFVGADWEAVGETTRAQVEAGLSTNDFEHAIGDMLADLPAGLAWYESREARIQSETAAAEYHGIGAYLAFRQTPEPHLVLLSIVENSPAEAAGLQAHESIYAIDSSPVLADGAMDAAARIRGPAGTTVRLTVRNPAGAQRQVSVQRAAVTAADPTEFRWYTDSHVGYLRVPVDADPLFLPRLSTALLTLEELSPTAGLVLDLRVARSTEGWPLSEMLSLFTDGPVGELYTRTETKPYQVRGEDRYGSQRMPLVVLIGPDTAGHPEVLAGALQATGRARLVGLPTPGDVELMTELPLPNGARAFIATSSFRMLDGREIGRRGVMPDRQVQADWDQVTRSTDAALVAAIQELTA